MKTSARHLTLLAALGLILTLAGCSEPLVAVQGKVHKSGEPLAIKEMPSAAGGRVTVRFHCLDQDKKDLGPHGAIVKADGTFSVPGATGKGIPPGKYRVEIKWQDPFPMGKDKLDGKFGKENSPVVVDIPSQQNIDIDVANVAKK